MGARVLKGRGARWGCVVVAAVALALLLAWFWGWAVSRRALRAAEERFTAVAGDAEGFRTRHPDRDANAAAQELERLAGALSIDLVPDHARRRVTVAGTAPQSELSSWLADQLASGDGTVAAPPPEVAEYLDQRRATIALVARRLVHEEPPRWKVRAELGLEAPVPALLGHLRLSRVLLAAALQHQAAGRGEDAERHVDAAWRLQAALKDRPELISQLIVLAELRWTVAALRKLADVGPEWESRLASVDTALGLREALAGEALFLRSWSEEVLAGESSVSAPNARPGWRDHAARTAGRPLLRAGTAELLAMQAVLLEHARADLPCALDPAAVEREVSAVLSRWNVVGQLAVPNVVATLGRAARAQLDVEATRQLLAARHASRRGEAGVSRVVGPCPDWTWRRVLAGDGAIRLEWTGTAPASPSSVRSEPALGHEEVAADR